MVPLLRLFSDIQTFRAAKDVSISHDKLAELFNRVLLPSARYLYWDHTGYDRRDC